MKKVAGLAAGVTLAMVLTGCGGSSGTGSPPSGKSSSTGPSTTGTALVKPTVSGPLTLVQYQQELTELDQRIKVGVEAIGSVRTAQDLSGTMRSLSEALGTRAAGFDTIQPPAAAAGAHAILRKQLTTASHALAGGAMGSANTKCGGVVYASQSAQRGLSKNLAGAVAAMKKARLKFGTTLPNLGPEPADVRPDNGEVLVRRGSRGRGELKVNNGGDKDVAIAVVGSGATPAKPTILMFVQSGKIATVKGISGSYNLYFKGGKDWDPKRRQFNADCTFSKFQQSFGANMIWTVSLKKTVLGNAPTGEVDAF